MIEKIPFKEYQAKEGLNISLLKKINKSPAHLHFMEENPQEDTASLLLGRAIHAMTLEPNDFNNDFCVIPNIDKRTKEGKQAYLDAITNAQGRDILTASDYEKVQEIANQARSYTPLLELLSYEKMIEVSMFWESENVKCKGRMDMFCPSLKTIVDLKTTADASQDEFARSIFKYGYHNQAAWYLQGCKANNLIADHFVIIAIEKEPPYCCAAYRLTDDVIELARQQNEKWLRTYKECSCSNDWFGYPTDIQDIAIPAWAIAKTDKFLLEDLQ